MWREIRKGANYPRENFLIVRVFSSSYSMNCGILLPTSMYANSSGQREEDRVGRGSMHAREMYAAGEEGKERKCRER